MSLPRLLTALRGLWSPRGDPSGTLGAVGLNRAVQKHLRCMRKGASAEFTGVVLYFNNRKESVSTGPTKFEVQIVAQFDNHNSQVWRVSWNITSTLLASSGDDGCVRLWKGAARALYLLVSILNGAGRIPAHAAWVNLLPLSLLSKLYGQLEVHGHPEGRRQPAHRLLGSAHGHEHHRGFLCSHLSERPERDVCGKVGGVVPPPPKTEPVRTDNLTTPHTDSDRCCSLTNHLDPAGSKRCTRAKSLAPSIQGTGARPLELAVCCAITVFTKT